MYLVVNLQLYRHHYHLEFLLFNSRPFPLHFLAYSQPHNRLVIHRAFLVPNHQLFPPYSQLPIHRINLVFNLLISHIHDLHNSLQFNQLPFHLHNHSPIQLLGPLRSLLCSPFQSHLLCLQNSQLRFHPANLRQHQLLFHLVILLANLQYPLQFHHHHLRCLSQALILPLTLHVKFLKESPC